MQTTIAIVVTRRSKLDKGRRVMKKNIIVSRLLDMMVAFFNSEAKLSILVLS